jgi:ankyrin repeat domain-containing protein 50
MCLTISSLLVDSSLQYTNNLNTVKIGVVHFYFEYNRRENQRADEVIKSLLKQLIYQLDTIPENVEQAYQQFETRGLIATPNFDSFVDFFIACSKKFFTKVFIFLDAYDESLDEDKRTLVTALDKMLKSGPKIYVYMTTRPHLVGELSKELGEVEKLEIKAVDSDISKYLNQKLEPEKDLDPEIESNIKSSIMTNAKGM